MTETTITDSDTNSDTDTDTDTALAPDPTLAWQQLLDDACARVRPGTCLERRGTLTRLTGLVLEASGLRVPVGSQCLIQSPELDPVLAEVVGFSHDRAYLMPAGDVHGLSSGASVTPAAAFMPAPRLGHATHQPSDLDAGRLRLPLGDGRKGDRSVSPPRSARRRAERPKVAVEGEGPRRGAAEA